MLTDGFDFEEAAAMLALAGALEGTSPTPIIPPAPGSMGWSRVERLSPRRSTLLDNYWDVWRNDKDNSQYAIAIRGTVERGPSVLADLLSPLVNARLDLPIGSSGTLPFYLTRQVDDNHPAVGVHMGFALSLMLMLVTTDKPLLNTLVTLARKRASVFITGHSQGASVATLLTSFVHHASGRLATLRNADYKSYVFAPAKSGNDHYGYDFDSIVGTRGRGWSIVSTLGWVPQVPLTLQLPSELNTPNPLREYHGYKFARHASIPEWIMRSVEMQVSTLSEHHLKHLIKKMVLLKSKLASEPVKLDRRLFEAGEVSGVDGNIFGAWFDLLTHSILPSLNYALIGSVVPLFAKAGGNPADPGDFFWHHHLGNYWHYMQQQYGPGGD